MPTSSTIYGRIDNSSASNTNINVQPGAAVSMVFQSDADLDGVADELDGDAPSGGDLKLDADGTGGVDGGTTVSVDGGLTFQTFTFVLTGTFPNKGNAPPEIVNEELVLIELNDGTRVFFFTDPALQDEATADSVPQGSANIQNISFDPEGPVCFTTGTLIRTDDGDRPVEALKPGDLVMTLDHGLQPVRWIGASTCLAAGVMAPVVVPPAVSGGVRPLMVSQQHRLLIRSSTADLYFGEPEVLVSATQLVAAGLARLRPGGLVEYWHFMFDQHEIVFANGAPVESLYLGKQALDAAGMKAREEIETLFPGLSEGPPPMFMARPALRKWEAKALLRKK